MSSLNSARDRLVQFSKSKPQVTPVQIGDLLLPVRIKWSEDIEKTDKNRMLPYRFVDQYIHSIISHKHEISVEHLAAELERHGVICLVAARVLGPDKVMVDAFPNGAVEVYVVKLADRLAHLRQFRKLADELIDSVKKKAA